VRGEPVCDDDPRPENAQVVCRQLGYLGGQVTVQSHFGQVSDVFAMDNVACTGNEASFVDCPHVTEDNCGGHEGLGVICSNGDEGSGLPVTDDLPVMELVGGSGPHEGNILLNGQPICDDGYTSYGPQNAQVLCRMLGYATGIYTTNSQFGQVSDDFAMDEVECTGEEEFIWQCTHQTTDDCSGSEGFGVICSNDDFSTTTDPGHTAAEVELVGGSGAQEGNILVWGQPVCDDGHQYHGAQNARVVCRMLGYFTGQITSNSHFGAVSPSFGMDELQCTGNETSINDCPHDTSHNCGTGEGLGVICSEIELVGGSGPHEGNVLVRGEPVCDDDPRPENAQVVCRQLGYLGGQVTVQSHFGQVSDVFAMDNVACTGNEASFVDCPHVTEDNCGGHEGLGVICSNGVDVGVQVKSATTNQVVEGVSVQFTIGDQQYDLSTDSNGLVVFTLSPDAPLGQSATIVVSGDGYVSVSVQRLIRADVSNPLINIFTSPELAEGEHRLVLSWDTDTDLDIYAMGMDKTTGEIVCKTWYADGSGCAGVSLDVDTYGFGPETITWTDADNDAYIYMLYVHDYDGNGVAGTGARITLYGETAVEMEVAGGDTGELWWTLGTFEPSVGTPSFLSSDQLQTSDPDSRNGRSIDLMRKDKPLKTEKLKEDEPLKNSRSKARQGKAMRKAHKPQAHKPQAKLKARQAKLNAIEKQKANEQIGTSV